MFKKSKRKIIATIMTVLTVLWIVTLGIILVISNIAVSTTNLEMLEEYVGMYSLVPQINNPDFWGPFQPKDGPRSKTNQFKLSTFYAVALSYQGHVITVNNDKTDIYSDDELEELAVSVVDNNKTTGVVNNLVYYKTDKGGYILVAFMDNTIIKESMDTVFRYALTIGGAAILVLFFLSVYLAGRIVKPLEEGYERQKQFISDAGHELKTPVSIVNANAELLAREIGDNQWLANIQYENDRMGALVTQLLELARTENVTPQFEEVNFSRLVSGEALPFESVVFEKGMILTCDIAENLKVLGNTTQLKQITSILIDNAVKHAAPNSEIVLKLSSVRKRAVLSVVNDGKEIPYEQRKNIFERFYRVDTARNGDDKHYGLGLAIAKAIVTTHNGKIDVSCFDGKVKFTVQIPLEK